MKKPDEPKEQDSKLSKEERMVMDLPDQVGRAQPKAKPSAQELMEQMRQKQANKDVLKNLNGKGKPSAAAVQVSNMTASELAEMKLVVPGSSNK